MNEQNLATSTGSATSQNGKTVAYLNKTIRQKEVIYTITEEASGIGYQTLGKGINIRVFLQLKKSLSALLY